MNVYDLVSVTFCVSQMEQGEIQNQIPVKALLGKILQKLNKWRIFFMFF